LDEARIQKLLGRLQYLARRNRDEFQADTVLLARFSDNLSTGRHEYKLDPDVPECGQPDCWNTYRELLARDRDRLRIRLDCEDASAALAGALALRGKPALMGLRPGKKISHAVAGLRDADGTILLDPAVWAGMKPLSDEQYRETRWIEV
jgi:hypothetical protein